MSQLSDYLKDKLEITMVAEHINFDQSDTKHAHDNWKITLCYAGRLFSPDVNYKTGTGHRVPQKFSKHGIKKERGGYYNSVYAEFKNEHDAMRDWFEPATPNIADVLNAYLVDFTSGVYTHEEYCSAFGISTDSILGLKIYLECQKIRYGLLNLFGCELAYKLSELKH